MGEWIECPTVVQLENCPPFADKAAILKYDAYGTAEQAAEKSVPDFAGGAPGLKPLKNSARLAGAALKGRSSTVAHSFAVIHWFTVPSLSG